jgi:Fe-S-cluster containining protein
MATVHVLGENRYRCYGCGSCCFGHAIELLDDDEKARIEEAGAKLGVEQPVEGNEVRFENHRCVFHDEDRLCRIHKELGSEVKPLRCQLWPLKIVPTEDGLRFGLDPGCLNTWRTWDTAEVQQPAPRMVPAPVAVGPAEAPAEEQLLGLLQVPGITVAGVCSILAGGRDLHADELPEGVATRIVARLQALRMGQLLAKPELGDGIREPLAHLPAAIDALDRDAPPAFGGTLSPAQQAFVGEVARRKVWLRQAPVQPATHGLVVLTLVGAVACAWADPEPEVFGPALSAWSRLMRFQAFWLRLAPDHAMLRWILTGEYEGAFDPWGAVGS